MQFVVAFVAAALLVWWFMMPPTLPLATKAVAVEGIRVARLDETAFLLRWSPVAYLPPMRERVVEYEPLLFVSHETPPPVRGAMAAAGSPVRPPLSRSVSLRHRDVCARHGMHRVFVGRYRWRCRR